MLLSEGVEGRRYCLLSDKLPEAMKRRLESLGLTEGYALELVRKKGAGIMIVKIRGTRFALGARMTQNMVVEPAGDSFGAQTLGHGREAGIIPELIPELISEFGHISKSGHISEPGHMPEPADEPVIGSGREPEAAHAKTSEEERGRAL